MGDVVIWTNIFLGVVQGITELLPISSSGHLVIIHAWLGASGEDLAFDGMLHFATALAIFAYFYNDIKVLLHATWRVPGAISQGRSLDESQSVAVAIGVATIPAVVLGIFLEEIMATVFRNPQLVAGTLAAGALLMILAEWRVRINNEKRHHVVLGWKQGIIVGLFQSLALIPGMSRSGMTIVGGMFVGLQRKDAARFGFLLGIPLLLGAGAKKIIDIGVLSIDMAMFAGAAAAFLVALVVIHYLLEFLRNNSLYVFIVYRMALAAVILMIF
tara:strand:- start:26132 stop:26947 length:816 start_codon:yes stop_codon:yes gene_type:complete